ncbi:MAG: hypothetical protein IJY16_09385 [Clostridia bacterium]|nr:hypothetical protein [Clostridia bacterium]
MEGVRRGIALTTNTLFPSLFPFLVLSELLVTLGAGEVLGKGLQKPLRLLFGVSGSGAAAFLLGALCGFPTGTATAVALYKKNAISKEELARLFLFVNNPSPGFLVSVVGGAMLGNASAGAALFAATTLSSVLIGITLRLLLGPVPERPPAAPASPPPFSAGDVGAAIKRGFSTMLQVVALVLFFSAMTACLTERLHMLSTPKYFEVCLIGILELTSGVNAAVTALPPYTAFLLCAFFAGFSGLSVCMQVLAVAEEQKLSVWPYLLSKIAQGALSLGLAAGYLKIWQPTLKPSEAVFYPTEPKITTPGYLVFFTLFFLFLAILAMALKRKTTR